MKRVFYLLTFTTIIFYSCTDSKSEKKIQELEDKIAMLEAEKGGSTSTPMPASENVPDEKPEGPLPVFEFKQDTYDFGTVEEGDLVDYVFEFKNTGEAPLIISNAVGSCGCTVPQWPKEPIQVGGSGQIKVQFNSRGKPGLNNKTVTITANTFPKSTKLTIKGNVKAKPQTEPSK